MFDYVIFRKLSSDLSHTVVAADLQQLWPEMGCSPAAHLLIRTAPTLLIYRLTPYIVAHTSPKLSHEVQLQTQPYHGTQHGQTWQRSL